MHEYKQGKWPIQLPSYLTGMRNQQEQSEHPKRSYLVPTALTLRLGPFPVRLGCLRDPDLSSPVLRSRSPSKLSWLA